MRCFMDEEYIIYQGLAYESGGRDLQPDQEGEVCSAFSRRFVLVYLLLFSPLIWGGGVREGIRSAGE